jgi:hypothetical protein
MLHTLALAAALSLMPGQDQPLTISSDRLTLLGEFGPTRSNNKFLPGDRFYLAFDIENLKKDPAGVVSFSMGMEVTSTKGKIYDQPPFKQAAILPLGGNRLPARAWMVISLDTPPGNYNCKLTVTDLETKASKTIEKAFEIVPAAFGMVGMFTSFDDQGQIPAPLAGFPGQTLYLNFHMVGFGTALSPDGKKDKWPDVLAELRVYDQVNQPTNAKPAMLAYSKGAGANSEGLDFKFMIPMNRVGTYTVEVKAECKITGKTDKVRIPITVLQPAK